MKTNKQTPKRRLKAHEEDLIASRQWARIFKSEGQKSAQLLDIQLKHLGKLERRIVRLSTHIARKSR